jgi:hypothetical protein
VAIVDNRGAVIFSERIGNDAAGLARLLEILAEHDPIVGALPVAIETRLKSGDRLALSLAQELAS